MLVKRSVNTEPDDATMMGTGAPVAPKGQPVHVLLAPDTRGGVPVSGTDSCGDAEDAPSWMYKKSADCRLKLDTSPARIPVVTLTE